MKSAQCAGYKHHFDECVERVTHQQEHPDDHKGPKEDCVEECMFQLHHRLSSEPCIFLPSHPTTNNPQPRP